MDDTGFKDLVYCIWVLVSIDMLCVGVILGEVIQT